jgi:hypothetical protein
VTEWKETENNVLWFFPCELVDNFVVTKKFLKQYRAMPKSLNEAKQK